MNIKLKLIPVKCAVIMKISYIFWPKKEIVQTITLNLYLACLFSVFLN